MKNLTWILNSAAKIGIKISTGQLMRILLRNSVRVEKNGREKLADESGALAAIIAENEQKKIPAGFAKLSDVARDLGVDRTSLRDFVRIHRLPYLVIRGRSEKSSGRVACINESATKAAFKSSKLAKERARTVARGLRSELTSLTIELNDQKIPQIKAFVSDVQELFGVPDLHALYHQIKALKTKADALAL